MANINGHHEHWNGHTSHGNGNGYGHFKHGCGQEVPLDSGLSIAILFVLVFIVAIFYKKKRK